MGLLAFGQRTVDKATDSRFSPDPNKEDKGNEFFVIKIEV
jgi:hypothetical protein